MSHPTLEVRRLDKRYGAVAALTGVSCPVRHGEVLGLIGPNGAGKTAPFECIAGLLAADAGEVRYEQAPLDASTRARAL